MIELLFAFLILGGFVIFFSPSPYFGVFGILIQSISFSIIASLFGAPFFGLLIVLIYVGGLLVVFLFSTILSAERNPSSNVQELFLFGLGSCLLGFSFLFSKEVFFDSLDLNSLEVELHLGELFSSMSMVSIGAAWFLLMALMSVLCINFEHSNANLRYI
uniref:NADH-ubiquinone oxidoreductase chain 6 n=1 Tax=Ophiacantha linea TaxID=1357420 RepID=V9NJU4_9ECHI|nr:NADH dehydrogenase subunit 6 [Ophiacantha linea]AGQ49786.1 NADH dehydrogenase subunit 6 [Ophiacantha linea]